MPVFVGDHVLVQIRGRCYGQQIILDNMYKVTQGGAPGTTVNQNLTSLIGLIDAGGASDIMTPYLACLQGDYTSLEIRAQVIGPTRLAYVPSVSVHPGQGGDGTVANDSACITLRTALAGRNQVSNKHIGPVPDGISISGLLTLPYIADLATLGTALLQVVQIAPGSAVFRPVVYHRASNTSDEALNAIVGTQSRVQRRRTVGVGR